MRMHDASVEEAQMVLFEQVARDLTGQGYSILPAGLPASLVNTVQNDIAHLNAAEFNAAAIGRHHNTLFNQNIRTDSICWTQDSMPGCALLNQLMGELKQYLNRRLFLGLSVFESHIAQYLPGNFYKRHLDAFKGSRNSLLSNRVLSVVSYFNSDWHPEDGGELVIYTGEDDLQGIKVMPQAGTLVVFLSEEFPHEVLPAMKTRYSIAGWFRNS